MPLKVAYGGVVLDGAGRVLLREPANHYGGYVWTFAKGRPEAGETPEQAAVREVQQETGYEVTILRPIPGTFRGGTTVNGYFLMAAGRQLHEPDWETQTLGWATFAEARELIAQTTDPLGRERDLAVLAAAERLLDERGG